MIPVLGEYGLGMNGHDPSDSLGVYLCKLAKCGYFNTW